MKELKKRVAWLDMVRALAIIFVVCNHSIEGAYAFNLEAMQGYAVHDCLIALSVLALGRLGVPLFFFLSGYLLLDRDYDAVATKRFFKRNVLGLLITTEGWIVIYNLFNSVLYQMPLNLKTLYKNIFFLQNVDMSHMWYMPVILGIYLFLPFVANALRNSDIRNMYIPLLIAFICLFVRSEVNVVLASLGQEQFASVLDVCFSGGCYGIYFLFGYIVKKGIFERLSIPVLVCIVLVSYGITVVVEYFSYAKRVGYNVWYDNATLLIAGLALFVLLSRIQPENLMLSDLARCSFGIYLLHNPIMILLKQWIYLPSRVLQFFVIALLTLILSWACVWLVSKHRQLAKWVFFMK